MDGTTTKVVVKNPPTPWVAILVVAVIGIIIGIILSLIIFMIMYSTRSFFLEYCAHSAPYCTINDYIAEPETAMRWGYQADRVLYLSDDQKLIYVPPRANSNCIVEQEFNITIDYPRYCTFNVNGTETEFIQSSHNNTVYTNGDHHIVTRSHCTPISSTGTVPISGRPAVRW